MTFEMFGQTKRPFEMNDLQFLPENVTVDQLGPAKVESPYKLQPCSPSA